MDKGRKIGLRRSPSPDRKVTGQTLRYRLLT